MQVINFNLGYVVCHTAGKPWRVLAQFRTADNGTAARERNFSRLPFDSDLEAWAREEFPNARAVTFELLKN